MHAHKVVHSRMIAVLAGVVCTVGFARMAAALDSQGSNGVTVSVSPVDSLSNDDGQQIVAGLGSFGLTVTAVGADGSSLSCSQLDFSDDGSGLSDAVQLSDNGDGTCLLSVSAVSAGSASLVWTATDELGVNSDSGALPVMYFDQNAEQNPDDTPTVAP